MTVKVIRKQTEGHWEQLTHTPSVFSFGCTGTLESMRGGDERTRKLKYMEHTERERGKKEGEGE